jgi:hypothetical protein
MKKSFRNALNFLFFINFSARNIKNPVGTYFWIGVYQLQVENATLNLNFQNMIILNIYKYI